jgi:hypothetical protein
MTTVPIDRRADAPRAIARWTHWGPLCAAGLGLALLQGCANYQAASSFAAQTNSLTGTVKTEFAQLDALCTWQGELDIVTANRDDERPLDACRQYQAAQGRLADATVTVLEGYAQALAGLADDKPFDLSPDIHGLGQKLQGLKDKEGRALVSDREAGTLTKLADALLRIATERKRAEGIAEMARQVPDLRVTGQLLKSFFVASADAPPGRAQPPYRNFAAILQQRGDQSGKLLNGPALRAAEPIRTAELRRELAQRAALLKTRAEGGDPDVPRRIAEAIDAWLQALDVFEADALKTEPAALLERLKALRVKLQAVRQAAGLTGQGPGSGL